LRNCKVDGGENLLLNIYLGVSGVTLVLFILHNLSGINRAKYRLKDENLYSEKHNDFAGVPLSWIKMVIISFIPIYNILMLIVLLFCSNEVTKRTDEIIDKAFKEKEYK